MSDEPGAPPAPPASPVVALSGALDLAATYRVRSTMEEVLRDGVRWVRLDLSGTTFLDCAGLDALLWCVRRGRRSGVRVDLVDPSPAAVRVLAATRTPRRFPLAG